MRQIGARQEASRLGGIGSCGRELCCSSWLTDFRTVNTSAARYQQLSLNPLKLAGQCGKLKCCLNYELDSYVDALKEFPDMEGKKLLTKKGDAFLQKTDIFRRIMWFSYRSDPGVFIPLKIESVKSILEDNAKGETPEELKPMPTFSEKAIKLEPAFENTVGQDSLTRFDRNKGNKQKNNQRSNRNQAKPQNRNQGQKPKPQETNRPKAAEGNKPLTSEVAKSQQKEGARPPQKEGNRPQRPKQPNQNRNQSRPQSNQPRKPNPPKNDTNAAPN